MGGFYSSPEYAKHAEAMDIRIRDLENRRLQMSVKDFKSVEEFALECELVRARLEEAKWILVEMPTMLIDAMNEGKDLEEIEELPYADGEEAQPNEYDEEDVVAGSAG